VIQSLELDDTKLKGVERLFELEKVRYNNKLGAELE
jgi:hypothetical protein